MPLPTATTRWRCTSCGNLTRFDVTLPVEIWGLLRGGLNPKTNAVGSLVFLISALAFLAVELSMRRK